LETVDIDDVECTIEVDKAILCIIENDEIWIPKSQIDDESEVQGKGDMGTLTITKWIAKNKGII
jgi:hypothetical protein